MNTEHPVPVDEEVQPLPPPAKGDPLKWRVARTGEKCGSGRNCKPLAKGDAVRKFGVGLRCQACALNTFNELAPDEVYAVPVPMPTLPVEGAHVPRGHGIVAPRKGGFTPVRETVAKAVEDIKRRAAGDAE